MDEYAAKATAEATYMAKEEGREMSPVEERCARLDGNITKLEEWVGTIEDHLKRVLSPVEPSATENTDISAVRAPESLITRRVGEAADRVDALAYRLSRLDARVEA